MGKLGKAARALVFGCLAFWGLAASAQISVHVNGEYVFYGGTQPTMRNGRVLVPLRGLMEQLGAEVTWDPVTQTVRATRGSDEMVLVIGQRAASMNGRFIQLDAPAQIIGGSTMVPLRFVSEALGAEVKWQGSTQTVIITTDSEVSVPDPEPIPNPNPDEIPPIELFQHDAQGWLTTGETINVSMRGPSGSVATFAIVGFTPEVRMREVNVGVYVGEWTVPLAAAKPIAVDNATVVGRLERAGRESIVQAGMGVSIDNVQPVISAGVPGAAARLTSNRPSVSVQFDDRGGSGIDIETVALVIDGQNVTAEATVTPNFLAYRPGEAIAVGEHTVSVFVRDNAGNATSAKWEFVVLAPSSVVTSFTHNGAGQVEPGDVITFTLQGQERAQSVMVSIGEKVSGIELSPAGGGTYVGAYTVPKGQDFTSEPVFAEFRAQDGQVLTVEAAQRIGLQAPEVQSPAITSHEPNAGVDNNVTISGTAVGADHILVTIDYRTLTLGVIPVTGTLHQVSAEVDEEGNWSTQELSLDFLVKGQDTTYTVTAIAVSADGERSKPTILALSD